jgi:hypothetical protein
MLLSLPSAKSLQHIHYKYHTIYTHRNDIFIEILTKNFALYKIIYVYSRFDLEFI